MIPFQWIRTLSRAMPDGMNEAASFHLWSFNPPRQGIRVGFFNANLLPAGAGVDPPPLSGFLKVKRRLGSGILTDLFWVSLQSPGTNSVPDSQDQGQAYAYRSSFRTNLGARSKSPKRQRPDRPQSRRPIDSVTLTGSTSFTTTGDAILSSASAKEFICLPFLYD